MNWTFVFTTLTPFSFSILVIYLSNKNNQALKKLEIQSATRQQLFQHKIPILEKGFIALSMYRAAIHEIIIIYEGIVSGKFAEEQMKFKSQYAANLYSKVNQKIETTFILDLYLDSSKIMFEEVTSLSKEVYEKQCELENLAIERDRCFKHFTDTKNEGDHARFKQAYESEIKATKDIIPSYYKIRRLLDSTITSVRKETMGTHEMLVKE